jgi:REP element-mobilizing transposase RayT
VPHSARPEVDARYPLHVVLKVTDEVKGLRTAKAYQAIRRALQRCAARTDYRVVEISIQGTHVHLLAEAESKQALATGMQGFEISAAKQLNKQLGRKRGKVFASRYYAKTIKSRRRRGMRTRTCSTTGGSTARIVGSRGGSIRGRARGSSEDGRRRMGIRR